MEQEPKSVVREDGPGPAQDGLEPHEPPRLIELGSFTELTQGAGLHPSDAAELGS